MPSVFTKIGWLTWTDEFAPGDPAPSVYNDWHEWARVQAEAGLEQVTCGQCGRWKFPQELSGQVVASHPFDRDGVAHTVTSPICKACVTAAPAVREVT